MNRPKRFATVHIGMVMDEVGNGLAIAMNDFDAVAGSAKGRFSIREVEAEFVGALIRLRDAASQAISECVDLDMVEPPPTDTWLATIDRTIAGVEHQMKADAARHGEHCLSIHYRCLQSLRDQVADGIDAMRRVDQPGASPEEEFQALAALRRTLNLAQGMPA